MLANMGPTLRGSAPPYTPSGKASYARVELSYAAGAKKLKQAGHRGILFRWRADRGNVEKLLPKPLELVPHSDEIYLFLNHTQTTLDAEFLHREHPMFTNWHEALFKIPCAYRGEPGTYSWMLYKDVDLDYQVVFGTFRGLNTKLASFAKTFPERAQPLNGEMQPGSVAQMVVSRFDERIIKGSFKAERELSEPEIADAIDMQEFLNGITVRYMPDWANPDGQPIVHDLVMWRRRESGRIDRAWAGDAQLVFGDSPAEELDLLQPVEMLPSYYVHLHYKAGPGQGSVLHDYVDRKAGRSAPRSAGAMGPDLQGSSPPFTPGGTAAMLRSINLGDDRSRIQIQAGHTGILVKLGVERRVIEDLLPQPLSAIGEHLYILVNHSQSGINSFQTDPASGLDYLRDMSPQIFNWHEVLFRIPCSADGVAGHYNWVIYKDVDHGVLLGIYDGFATKLAHFAEAYPMPAQPLNAEMAPGGVARMLVSRMGEPVLNLRFQAERALSEAEIASEIDLDEMMNSVGVRFWPDFANPGGPPLVHDLVLWDLGRARIPRAWSGSATVELGGSDYEELSLLEPFQVLASHFIHLEYTMGYGGCKIVHDYVARPLAGAESRAAIASR